MTERSKRQLLLASKRLRVNGLGKALGASWKEGVRWECFYRFLANGRTNSQPADDLLGGLLVTYMSFARERG
jgi:hypothetical protein